MRALAEGMHGIYAWLLMDGMILSQDDGGKGPLRAWRRGVPGLADLLRRAGVEMSRWMLLTS
jgi:hypothetical protein